MKYTREQITPEMLRDVLRCDSETGKLYWLARSIDYFPSKSTWIMWNSQCSGKEAFLTNDAYGYLRGRVFNINFTAHRVIWAFHYGEWPKHEIDHINGVKTDNRIVNLRDVPKSENCKNKPLQTINTSGVVGVSWCKQRKKWLARISSGHRCKNLGRFTDKADAIAARLAAEKLHGFHDNHGRKAISSDPLVRGQGA
jgi:HNH endonuclease